MSAVSLIQIFYLCNYALSCIKNVGEVYNILKISYPSEVIDSNFFLILIKKNK